MYPCWPEIVGRRLQAKVFKFSQAGSTCADLIAQTSRCHQVPRKASGEFKHETLVIVHTCGNDFIMKSAGVFMGGGGLENIELMQPNPGTQEGAIMKQFLETMYRMGARHFLVSGVPIFVHLPIFNIAWPIIAGFVNNGSLEGLGVSPGDPPQLAIEVQAAALQDRWTNICVDFGKEHSDVACVFFDEVEALQSLRNTLGEANFDRQMWDFSMFHPTPFGHDQIAGEAHRCVVESIPALFALAPHPQATPKASPTAPSPAAGYAVAAPAAAPAAAAATATPVAAGESKNITLRLRNVKGDTTFTLECNSTITVAELKEKVSAGAPAGFAPPDATCLLALQGKFLENHQKLHDLNIVDNTQLIVVMKAKA